VGLVVSVPFVAWITLWLGWRAAFVLTGLLGFVWVLVWWATYQLPEVHPRITASELELIQESEPVVPSSSHIPYLSLLRSRSVWAVILARMFSDPSTWFYHYWLPEYLKSSVGFSLAEIGRYAWIPFATQGVGILLGGWFSDLLIRRDVRVVNARLVVMAAGMIMMTAGVLAAFPFPILVTFTGISVATFGFGLWAPNMMSLCGEAFPREAVGSVTGLSGMGAGLGGLALTLGTGWLVDHFGFSPVFVLVATMPLVAIVVLYTLLEKKVRI
jgi:ACS family hexuronate transporter-like MFS transporter